MPGGASNTGAEWIVLDHPGADPRELDEMAFNKAPTRLLRYPLCKRGERFPFIHPQANGFLAGDSADALEIYTAGLEGVAFLERLAYEMLENLGLETGPDVYITGGGAKSTLWSRIRSSVMNRALLRPAITETAMGAAMLAASGSWYVNIGAAAEAMIRIVERVEPVPEWRRVYPERYMAFVEELKRRGYILP
jgi:sugar (pentulose or hexulose) kinase